jgi:hypothetical protein
MNNMMIYWCSEIILLTTETQLRSSFLRPFDEIVWCLEGGPCEVNCWETLPWKISGKIFGRVRENVMCRFCTNQELMELCREPEKGRLRLLHVGMTSEVRTAKNVFKIIPEGKRSVGKPRERETVGRCLK